VVACGWVSSWDLDGVGGWMMVCGEMDRSFGEGIFEVLRMLKLEWAIGAAPARRLEVILRLYI